MNVKRFHPLGDWRRSHPTACRIAAELARFPALAGLRSRALVRDVRARFGVSARTAFVALRVFRLLLDAAR